MKKVFLMTTFVALALSSQAYAVDMDYNSDTDVNSDTTTAAPATPTHHHHKKMTRTKAYMSNGQHTNAGKVPAHSKYINDDATSRQGMPSGETNGPVSGQSDDQNYGQPMNH